MLVEHNEVKQKDQVLAMVATINGKGTSTKEIEEGIYEIGHFGGSHFMPSFEHYPDMKEFDIPAIGVCDYPMQILEKEPKIKKTDREFIICVHKVEKQNQPQRGGWRWHKWGEYIGDKDPKMEYIAHEPKIEKVWTYHIYELKD